MYFLIVAIIFYISLCGFLAKAGYPFWSGLIPIYNFALLFVILDLKPILLMILGLLLIFLPDGMIVITLMYVFMPFLISYRYGRGFWMGIFTLLLPFIGYPLLAFKLGNYY